MLKLIWTIIVYSNTDFFENDSNKEIITSIISRTWGF